MIKYNNKQFLGLAEHTKYIIDDLLNYIPTNANSDIFIKVGTFHTYADHSYPEYYKGYKLKYTTNITGIQIIEQRITNWWSNSDDKPYTTELIEEVLIEYIPDYN